MTEPLPVLVNSLREAAAEQPEDADLMLRAADELERLSAYADRLAAGLPEGMLPKDIENLRVANVQLASHLEKIRQHLGHRETERLLRQP